MSEVDPSGAAGAEVNPTRRTALSVGFGILAVPVIGAAGYQSIKAAAGGTDVRANLTLVAPAAAGGGWDAFQREMQQAMRAHSLVGNVQVLNIPGAGGTIAIGSVAQQPDASTLMVGGTGQIAAQIQFSTPSVITDVTPVARVIEEFDLVAVAAESPYEDLDQLVSAWREDPPSLAWTGGGSFDQLIITELALAADVPPGEVTYIPSDGGGEAIQAVLNDTAQATAGGFADIYPQVEAGRLRAIGVAAPERISGVDVPTLPEQGLDVTLTNWRALFAPPAATAEQVDELEALIAEAVETPEWKSAVERNYWREVPLDSEGLTDYITEEADRIGRLFEEMGS